MQAAALDLGLHTEASAIALWAQAQHRALELSEIEPMLSNLRQRLQEVSTCSTLVGHVLINVLSSSGRHAEAQKLTDEIIDFANTQNESVYLPEILTFRGEQLAKTDLSAAQQTFLQAIELARATGARSLELRASASLAALTTK